MRARAERGEMTGRWGLDTQGGARKGAAFSDGTRTARRLVGESGAHVARQVRCVGLCDYIRQA